MYLPFFDIIIVSLIHFWKQEQKNIGGINNMETFMGILIVLIILGISLGMAYWGTKRVIKNKKK